MQVSTTWKENYAYVEINVTAFATALLSSRQAGIEIRRSLAPSRTGLVQRRFTAHFTRADPKEDFAGAIEDQSGSGGEQKIVHTERSRSLSEEPDMADECKARNMQSISAV